jgi:glycerate 2-kinase
MRLRDTAEHLFRVGLKAVLPEVVLREHVRWQGDTLIIQDTPYPLRSDQKIYLFGSGKAAIPMARTMEDIFGDQLAGGTVVSSYLDPSGSLSRIQVLQGSHPVPDAKSLAAGDALLREMTQLNQDDFFIYLLSGGSSALIEKPAAPVTLAEMQATTRLLLDHKVTINEVNTVRKHLSAIKGGGLGARVAARGAVLVISDVVNDDLETIGSAPLYYDSTTFAAARTILRRADLWERVPAPVRQRIEQGAAGTIAETPKKANDRIRHFLVASNRRALESIRREAIGLGFTARIMTAALEGEAREVARVLIAMAREVSEHHTPFQPPACLLFGGETTVQVKGSGRGGRNQELALAALKAIGNHDSIALLAAGTDGIDGNTEDAGAVADAMGYLAAQQRGLAIDNYLDNNDANGFFQATGGLMTTGPTGTNVMDIVIILVK